MDPRLKFDGPDWGIAAAFFDLLSCVDIAEDRPLQNILARMEVPTQAHIKLIINRILRFKKIPMETRTKNNWTKHIQLVWALVRQQQQHYK